MSIRGEKRKEGTLSIEGILSREEVRKFMLCTFLKEECKVKLRYYVETLSDQKKIYIERPGALNKGCDFVVYVEDLLRFKNGNDRPPKHDDVIADIKMKKEKLSQQQYAELLKAIECIYEVRPYSEAETHTRNLPKVEGWSYELLLKFLRWLFVEQDITYWAGEGRSKLYDGILDI